MRPFLSTRQKKPFHTGCVQAYIVLIVCRSVSAVYCCVCVIFMVVADGESRTRPISTNLGSMEAGKYQVWANARDVIRRTPSQGGRGHRAAADCVVCSGCGRISCFFTRLFFFRCAQSRSFFNVINRR